MKNQAKFQPVTLSKVAGIILILESLVIFVPMIIMGISFNWPENLSKPASYNFSLLIEQATVIKSGYLAYLFYSILFFVAILMVAQVTSNGKNFSAALNLGVGFGALSSLARSLGILRWLTAIPILADIYTKGTLEEQTISTLFYETLNSYGGAIGELLGVSIFASFALLGVAIGMLQSTHIPKWLAYFGLVSSVVVFLQSLEVFGVEVNSVIMVSALQFWMLASGIVFLRMKTHPQPILTN